MSEMNKKEKNRKICRVPVIIQLEALECGAASLAMVLAYYSKYLSLEQVRRDCGVSRDGVNAFNIVRAAESYGLTAGCYSCEFDDLVAADSFPCIIHWQFDHFMVLRGIDKKHVYLNDPAKGEIRLTIAEFLNGFTGVAILLSPSDDFVPSGNKPSRFGYIGDYIGQIRASVVFAFLTSAISYLLHFIEPGFTRVFFDQILSGMAPDWFYPFMILLTAFFTVQLILSWITTIYSYRINGKLALVGSAKFMWKLLNLPMNFYSQRMIGDVLGREESNASVANTIVTIFSPLLFQLVSMVFYFIIMIRYSLLLTIVSLVAILTNIIVSNVFAEAHKNLARVSMTGAAKKEAATISGFNLIETIKASGAENGFFEKWSGYQAEVLDAVARSKDLTLFEGMIPQIVSIITSTITLAIGIYLTIKGEFTLGMISAFQSYLAGFTAPVSALTSSFITLDQTKIQVERLNDVMTYPEDRVFSESANGADSDDLRKFSGDIDIKNITFGYAPLDEPLIKDFSLHIRPGERIAIVGSSGCGKSTLARLISGLYKPWSGEILFDGKKMSEIDKSVFTSSVAVVDQDITIFEDTIRNNVKMWDDSIEDFEMTLACRDAQILDDINEKEGSFNYRLSQGGRDFSGGQRQRLEIARVLAQDPTVIILDEATSALDARTEYEVVESINNRGITCIIIAHRLSTVRDCDRILVLEHGDVVETGTHDELMAKNGYYAKLISNN